MVGNGKHIKTFKGSVGEDGTLIKVVLDRSGVYLGKFDFFFVKTQWGHRYFEKISAKSLDGKHIKTFKGSVGEDGTLIKVVLDRSGVYLGKFEFFSSKHNGDINFLKMRDKPEMEVS